MGGYVFLQILEVNPIGAIRSKLSSKDGVTDSVTDVASMVGAPNWITQDTKRNEWRNRPEKIDTRL